MTDRTPYLLLLEYWHNEYDRNYRHGQAEIVGFRNQLSDRMTTNFYNYLEANLPKIYQKARKYVQVKSGLNKFPQDCPYTLQQLLDEDWLPKK
ncbi:hypothetical protein cce_1201 [Crocosphaera subtropica ATCC 51142]|uniref:DUF29 domain-containing protein n=1 Tax=Crocosphaera subtropica (strain ATCC 51142 / BH68) TaxID=43989 RepID=B1WUV0_CROS5|nr:hypothetical protein cce_1201 [Crocosphaera subtropica ATCC 51142]